MPSPFPGMDLLGWDLSFDYTVNREVPFDKVELAWLDERLRLAGLRQV